ncbi:MAG TPA: hypothetical protein VHL11_22125, partial [Phototrophicaceae bacterium]|nr:hypothetical protein [Phototrophicaceae bacterium]
QINYNTVNNRRGMHLGGIHAHKYPGGALALYVYDSGNNRILGFINPVWTSASEIPDRVFGQNDSYQTGSCNADSTSGTVNPTARTLCLNTGFYSISKEEEPHSASVTTDANGNFFILDEYNNRILMFLDPFGTDPGEGDTTADMVWGQPDFESKVCNRGLGVPNLPTYNLTADMLCIRAVPTRRDELTAASVVIDKWGNLWATDVINNRVLRYPYDAVTGFPSHSADIVLGQPDMHSYVNNLSSCVYKPEGVGFCPLFFLAINSATGELFVTHDFERTTVWVFSPDQIAQNPTTYTYSRAIGLFELNIPGYIHFLDATRFMIKDWLEPYQEGYKIYNTDGTYIRTIGKSNVVGNTPDGPVNFNTVQGEFAFVDNLMFLVEQRDHNSVLVLDASELDSQNKLTYKGELLGGENYLWNNITGLGARSPFGFTVSQKHKQAFMVDGYRVMVWNTDTPFAGRSADFVVGQPNPNTNKPDATGPFVFREAVRGVAVDEVNNKLWVARNQEIYAFDLPITTTSPLPVINLSTSSVEHPFAGNIHIRGQADNLNFRASAVAINPMDQTLWIVELEHSRVTQITNPYTSPTANLIVGQVSMNEWRCNRGVFTAPTAKTLCFPPYATFDHHGNLYISEGVFEGRADMPGNKRIVEYDRATIDAAAQAGLFSEPAADRVYGVPNFTTNPIDNFTCLPDTPCNPMAMSLNANDEMVVLSDAYFNAQNKRIYIYSNALKNPGYVAFDPAEDKILPYGMGQGGIPFFSDTNKLYLQDHTWSRVMVVNINNQAPAVPEYVQPANEEVEQPLNLELQWSVADDPDNDLVNYNVYFGEDAASLTQIATHQTATNYPVSLSGGITYYWQIGATDGFLETRGSVWSFTTINQAAVVISESDAVVSESGTTDSYTLQLAVPPLTNVNISLALTPDQQISADPMNLAFTPENWNLPQTVTLSTTNDTMVEGTQIVSIT